VPVEFLSDEQVAEYGRFTGELSRTDVEGFFYLTESDLRLVAQRRSDVHRIGFGVQLGTVRALGRFLEDPLDVPWLAVEFVAEQLGIADPSRAKQYLDRPKTAYEHAWEIRTKRGYHLFEEPDADVQFQRFLDARTWTQAEGPVALFEHCVIWLHTEPGEDRFHRVVLTSWLLDTLAPHLLRLSGLPGADLLAGIPHARARNRPRSTPPERRSIACTMRRRRRPPKSRQ